MASASNHPAFPTRSFPSNLHSKLPERSLASNTAFGTSSHQPREGTRLERERLDRERSERGQRERQERETQNQPMAELTEEQREEINEAVSTISFWD